MKRSDPLLPIKIVFALFALIEILIGYIFY